MGRPRGWETLVNALMPSSAVICVMRPPAHVMYSCFQVQDLFNRSIDDARSGFKIALVMDVVLFTFGILMLGAAGGLAIANNTYSNW